MIKLVHRSEGIPDYFIFLDRDGIINKNQPNYVLSEDAIVVYEKSIKAMKLLKDSNIGVVIVSNQQCIGKNLISIGQAIRLHESIIYRLGEGMHSIYLSYLCPHLKKDQCRCRKPGTAMLEHAQKHFSHHQFKYFIGDAYSDIKSAKKFGIKALLVNKRDKTKHSYEFPDLLSATHTILRKTI